MPHGKKHRDPGADDRMKKFESSLRGVMQEKPKKKGHKCPQCTTPATCAAQGRCRLHGNKL